MATLVCVWWRYPVLEKFSQERQRLFCQVCGCTILPKQAISIFYLQQYSELYDDILIDVSRHSQREENWADNAALGDSAPSSYFL